MISSQKIKDTRISDLNQKTRLKYKKTIYLIYLIFQKNHDFYQP